MFRLLLAQFRLLGAKFDLCRVTLNPGVCLGYSVIIIGHPGLGVGLGDSGVCFSFLVLVTLRNVVVSRGPGSQVRLLLLFWAQFLYSGFCLLVLVNLGYIKFVTCN